MKIQIYDHRSGLKVVPEYIVKNIEAIIENVHPTIKKNSVATLKKLVRNQMKKEGWVGEYRLDASSRITISSYLDEVGLCFQTGNCGRIYADLLKLQTLYVKGKIKAGIILIPQNKTAVELGGNVANYERVVRELPIFSQVLTIPLVIIGFDGTED